MNHISTEVGYLLHKNKIVCPIDGTNDHIFTMPYNLDAPINITQRMREELDAQTYDTTDSFTIHKFLVFEDRLEVTCSVVERGLCHVGLDG